MAEQVTTSRIVELLDNKQFIAALEAARQQEEKLTAARVAGGRQGVAALKAVEAAARKQAQAIEVSAAAAQVATDSTGRMTAGMASLRSQLIDIGVSLQGGMNPLTVLSQQGPQVAEALALMGPAAVAASAAFAPLLVALPILAGGYLAYSQRAEEAAEAQKKATEEAAEAQKVYKDLYAALTDASIEQAVLSGAMSETEAAQTRAAIAIGDRFGPALERAGEKLRALRAELKEYEYSVGDGTQATEEERAKLAQLRVETEKAETDYDRLAVSVRDLTDAQTTNIGTSDRLTKSRKAGTKALKDEQRAIEEALAYLRKEEEAERQYFLNLGKAQEDAARAEAKLRQEQLDDFNAMLQAEGRAEARRLNESEAAYYAAQQRKRQVTIETAEDLTAAYADAFGELSEALGDSNEDAAYKAWQISQTIGVIQATIAASKAAAETMAAVAAIPGGQPFAVPAGLAMFAAVEGATVAKIAATPPPTFGDTPMGGWQPSAQNRSATFAQDDTVIAARDPRALIAQAVAATANRPLPRPATRKRERTTRSATTPTSRLLTSDLSLTTRGRT